MGGLVAQYSNTSSGMGAGAGIAFFLLAVVVYLFYGYCYGRIFQKAGRPLWEGFVPIYNYYVMLKIIGRPGWWLILYLIPIVNIVITVLVYYDLSRSFGKGVGFTLGLCLLTGLGFGLVPALQSTNPDLAQTLKNQAGNIAGDGAQFGFRKATVAIQTALCLLLLIGASLFLRSLSNLRSIDPGFRTTNLLRFSVAPRSAGYDVNRTVAFYQSLEDRLKTLPGIRSAAYASMAVLTATGYDLAITIEGSRYVPALTTMRAPAGAARTAAATDR